MKNTIMIVRPKEENKVYTKNDIQELYRFLVLVGGNYRNALYTECRHCGYMITADIELRPILFPVQKFYDLTGEYPQRDEMAEQIGKAAFESVYRRWLMWNTDSNDECGICCMYEYQERGEAK